jgi:hypothetical protein
MLEAETSTDDARSDKTSAGRKTRHRFERGRPTAGILNLRGTRSIRLIFLSLSPLEGNAKRFAPLNLIQVCLYPFRLCFKQP